MSELTNPGMQHHAVKIVHKAVKKSKTFELQKLTRKLKSTR